MPYELDELKRLYFAAVDVRTDEVLARGFTYNSVTVSLSTQALVRYQTYLQMSTLFGTLTVEAADDLDPPLSLTSIFAIDPFVSAVNAHVRAVWDAHNAVKAQIRASDTLSELESVVDTR